MSSKKDGTDLFLLLKGFIMKREFLENLGLDRKTIDSVMSENGKSIEKLKEKCSLLEAKCSDLDSLSEENSSLKEKISVLSSQLEKTNNLFNIFCDSEIKKITDSLSFSSAIAKNSVLSLMKDAAYQGKDVYSVIEELKKSDPSAFSECLHDKPFFSLPVSGSDSDSFDPKNFFLRRHK